MRVRILTDTRVKGKYTKAGATVEVTKAEAARLIALGWAREEKSKKDESPGKSKAIIKD